MSRGARFVLLFVAYVAAANALILVPAVADRCVDPWTRFCAASGAAIAGMFGVDSEADGATIVSGAARLDVKEGCNGVHALVILLASILAFPATWGSRTLGVAVGAVAILGANLVRIVNLIVVARYDPAHLKLFHAAVWETLIMLVAVALFVLWWRLLGSRTRPTAPAA